MNPGWPLPAMRQEDEEGKSARTPLYLYILGAVLALLVGAAAASLKLAVMAFAVLSLTAIVISVIVRPVNGFLIALAIYPFYTLFRGLMLVYKINGPAMAVLGLWPELFLCLMAAGILIDRIRARERLKPFTWHDLPFAILLLSTGYGVVLTLAQKMLGALVYGFHEAVMPFLFYAVARWMRPHRDDLRRVVTVWLIGYTLLALGSTFDYIFRPGITIRVAMEMRDGFWRDWDPIVFWKWYPRMQGLLFAEQLWGTISAWVSIYCLVLMGEPPAWPNPRHRPRWIVPLFMLSTGCMILSMSRGAYVCYVVALFVLLWYRGRHRRAIAIMGALTVVVLAAAFIFFSHSEPIKQIARRATALTDSRDRNAYDRVDQWKWAIDDFPLFPSGRGTGVAGRAAIFHGLGTGHIIPDGGYWKTMAEVGLPGLLLFFVGAPGVAYVLWRTLPYQRGPDRVMGLTTIGFFGGLLVQNIAGNLFDIYYIPAVMWFFIGMMLTRRDVGLSASLSHGETVVYSPAPRALPSSPHRQAPYPSLPSPDRSL